MKYKHIFSLLVTLGVIFSVWLPSCKPREEELQITGGLEFSADTVKFDTVFTTLRTVTKRLWVYNRNPKGVTVDFISLDNPNTSPYTLIINGDLKQTTSNTFIRGQDSLLILVRAQLKDNNQNGAAKDYVIQENLNFRTNGQDQQVVLRSFGRNIYLHDGVTLPCNAIWTNDRPHVLYDSVTVPAGCKLTIKPGTRIYAHAGAALVVKGTLLVNSPADFMPSNGLTDTISTSNANVVRFSGDRLESLYATAPGQWRGIILASGSQGNIIRYAQIQNASFGVLLYNPLNQFSPDVKIQNSVIRYISGNNMSFAGLASNVGLPGAAVLNVLGTVIMENTLLTDCYEYALLGVGGTSSLNFCTIANYPATAVVRQTQSLSFTNTLTVNGVATKHSPSVDVRNSIVWGSATDELYFESYNDYKGQVSVRHSLLRTQLYAAATDGNNKPGLTNTAYDNLTDDPQFVRQNSGGKDDYRLKLTSPARKRASPVGNVLGADLLNLPRSISMPSLGAYESTK
jgi:hypothetical protein